MRYDVIEKIGEGNRGEVYKVRLENGKVAALKWAKNYEIEKEWEILNYLNGFYAPKPVFRGKRFFIMEYINGVALKNLLNSMQYYKAIKQALIGAFYLDEKGVFHKQLGRYYHILFNEEVKFIDFERAVFSNNPRNFLQIIGYYLIRDENFDKKKWEKITLIYKNNRLEALNEAKKVIDEIINKKIFK